ncbi:MAG TPA: terminase [Ruminiclostridium sp.]|nr:terminase [Ruminiclostridium sp.]
MYPYDILRKTDGPVFLKYQKSTEKIDGAVATIMALDRAIRNNSMVWSVYDKRGILVL